MDLGLSGATACVSGGTKGMGRAVATAFAQEGARVVVLARSPSGLDETVAALTAAGSPDAFGIAVDVTDAGGVDEAFRSVGERWGELNALVCAAGPAVIDLPWREVSDEQWLAAYDVGALGAVRCARAAFPLLTAASWGRIVTLAAMSTRSHGRGLIEYTAAKSALTSITKTLSMELAPHGILANVVSPGTFVTEHVRSRMAALPSADGVDPADLHAVMEWIQRQYSVRADLGRAGDPAEIAAVICFLASRLNSYTTGAHLNVDGGSAFFA